MDSGATKGQYERSYGYLYEEGRGKSTAQIAKMVRREIKTAVSEGLLPARWSYSVRTDTFAGGSSIDVRVKDCADAWMPCPGYKIGSKHETPGGGWTATGCGNPWCKAGGEHRDSEHAQYHDVMTEEAEAARMTLKRIHDGFNHDGSDMMTDYFDVNYYGSVKFQDASDARFEAEEKQRVAARRAALDGMTNKRRVQVFGRNGVTVHVAGDVDGKMRLVCGARPGRYSVGVPAPDAEVTCSRCAKREQG